MRDIVRQFFLACLTLLALGFTTLLPCPALADDAPFLGTDPASVLGQGEKALQQWVSLGHGHVGESYSSVETQTEFDYGVTDRLQLSLSLLYDWSRAKPASGLAVSGGLIGVQGEAVWQVMAAENNPLGLAIAVDPAFNPSERGLAARMLFTTYVAHFENVLNINFENNWNKDGAGHWQSSSAIVFNYGLAHALNKHWTIGVEFGNESSFSSLLTNANLGSIASTFFAGPSVQYESNFVTISFGVETQLPISTGGAVANGYTPDAERWRAALRLTRSI